MAICDVTIIVHHCRGPITTRRGRDVMGPHDDFHDAFHMSFLLHFAGRAIFLRYDDFSFHIVFSFLRFRLFHTVDAFAFIFSAFFHYLLMLHFAFFSLPFDYAALLPLSMFR